MFDVITGSFFALLVLPFFGTIILAGIIGLAGRGASRKVLISASTGIGTAWVCAFVLGIPSFQNTFDSNSMPHIILVGLLLGALIDHLLPELGNKYKIISWSLDLIFAAAVIVWVRGEVDLGSILIFLIWGCIQFSAHRLSNDARMPALMVVIAAIGLAIIAWIGDILADRNLAFGVSSTGLGFLVWLWFKRDLPLGFSFFWSSFTALLLIALRIIEANPLMAVPILILGFVFFTDSILSQKKLWPTFFKQFAAPIIVCALSILPIVLASVSALVATTLINY